MVRLLMVVVAAVCCACGRSAQPPNVLLIVVDTLRADHLGCYGYTRNTSPRINRFAEQSTLYTRAMASAPWTVPSHASMFTGLDPFEHKAHTCKLEAPEECVFPLAERHTTLAEVLRDQGYRTAGFVANAAYMHAQFQLDQGFEDWNGWERRAWSGSPRCSSNVTSAVRPTFFDPLDPPPSGLIFNSLGRLHCRRPP